MKRYGHQNFSEDLRRSLIECKRPHALTLVDLTRTCPATQSLVVDVGPQLWASPASDPFYLDLALTSADGRFANRRPRVRVRLWPCSRIRRPWFGSWVLLWFACKLVSLLASVAFQARQARGCDPLPPGSWAIGWWIVRMLLDGLGST